MGRPVEPLALSDLARRLDALADALPANPSEVGLAAAIGHGARLNHITDSAAAFVVGALRNKRPVPLPEREVVEQLTGAMARVARSRRHSPRRLPT
jgi:hypothetical protein